MFKRLILVLMLALATVSAYGDFPTPKLAPPTTPISQCYIYDIDADWCGPCQRMKKNIWPDPRVKEQVSKYKEFYRLNFDNPKNVKYNNYYKIGALPATLIIRASDGALVKKVEHEMSVEQLLDFLKGE